MKNSIQEIKKKIAPILKRHDVRRAAIFGSFVRGEEDEKSDIDILVILIASTYNERQREILASSWSPSS